MRISRQQLNFFGNQLFQQTLSIQEIIPVLVEGTFFLRIKMANLNTGEYGQSVFANMEEDISGATDLTFILQPERGEKQTKTANISIGTVNIIVGDETLLANNYLIYVLQDGDLAETASTGTGWRTRGEATKGGKRIVGDFKKMTVLE